MAAGPSGLFYCGWCIFIVSRATLPSHTSFSKSNRTKIFSGRFSEGHFVIGEAKNSQFFRQTTTTMIILKKNKLFLNYIIFVSYYICNF